MRAMRYPYNPNPLAPAALIVMSLEALAREVGGKRHTRVPSGFKGTTALCWQDHETTETFFAALDHSGAGHFQRLVDRFCYLRICRPQATVGSSFGRDLWNCCLYRPATNRSHGPESPSAQAGASLYDHRRRIARLSCQSRAHWYARAASRRLRNRRLVEG